LELGRGLKKKVQDPFTRKDWYGIKVSLASTAGIGLLLTEENRLHPCSPSESKTQNSVELCLWYMRLGGKRGRLGGACG